MNRLEEIIKALKTYIGESVEAALEYLELILEHNSQRYNDFIQIKSRYKSLQRELLLGVLDHSTYDISRNNISKALVLLSEDITEKDLRPEDGGSKKKEDKRGEILYHVPDTMQIGHEEKCVVRIAFNIEQIKHDWEASKEDVIKSIRVSEIMAVVLLNEDENDPPFAIRTLPGTETVQFLDKDDFTEWRFYVKPLKAGGFPLLLKVSVIEMINNKEYKKDIVLEEKISVQTEEVPPPGEAEFKSAGTSIALSEAPLPLDAPLSAQKAGRGVAGVLLKGVAIAAILTVAALVVYKVYRPKPEDKNHPNKEAPTNIDSLELLSSDTLPGTSISPPPFDSSSDTAPTSSASKVAGPNSSSGNSTQHGPTKATDDVQISGKFFGLPQFDIVNSDGQRMDFMFHRYNNNEPFEVWVKLGSSGAAKIQRGMSLVLVSETGKPLVGKCIQLGVSPDKKRYDGYFKISPTDLERLAREKFKEIRLLDANKQPVGNYNLTSNGIKEMKKYAEKAVRVRKLNKR